MVEHVPSMCETRSPNPSANQPTSQPAHKCIDGSRSYVTLGFSRTFPLAIQILISHFLSDRFCTCPRMFVSEERPQQLDMERAASALPHAALHSYGMSFEFAEWMRSSSDTSSTGPN